MEDTKMTEFVQHLLEPGSESKWKDIDDVLLQQLIEFVIKAYAYKKVETNSSLNPVLKDAQVTETEVMILAVKLLDSMEIDLFEVQMFRSMCNY